MRHSRVKRYEYGRIERLGVSLEKAGVAQEVVDRIMAGGQDIRRGARPEEKAEWLRGAMVRMDELLSRCEKVPSTFKLPPLEQYEQSRCWLGVGQPPM
jgi:hypothetical protein